MDLVVQPRQVLSVLLPTVFLPILLGFAVHRISAPTAEMLVPVSDVVDLVGTARPNPAEQKAIAAAALGNPALALIVVQVIYHQMKAAVLVSVYVAVRAIAVSPLMRGEDICAGRLDNNTAQLLPILQAIFTGSG